MIRVLQVYPQMNNAGTERVILNLYENIDRRRVQFDFLVEKPGLLDNKLRDMGARIYYLCEANKKEYYRRLCEFFGEHKEYKIVHTHTHARMGIVLRAARKCGVPCRIAHSHNARNDLPQIAWFIKGLTSIPMELNATNFFACSSKAAKWLFPHKQKETKVIFNGIKLEDYLFSEDARNKKRMELGIDPDDFTLIHVGRFAEQKNHKFLIDILEEYRKFDNSGWKLLLVGDGPLETAIQERVSELRLSDHVHFLGNRNDVNELYSASDLFVFPSLHEGLGIVVVEAQASGLPCIVSDAIPQEADLDVNGLTWLSLKDGVTPWVNAIKKLNLRSNRDKNRTAMLEGNYNIKIVANNIQKFYLENVK